MVYIKTGHHHKGKLNPMFGKKQTPQTKEKIRLAALARNKSTFKKSKETRKRMSVSKKLWWKNHPEQRNLFSVKYQGSGGSNWQGGKTKAALLDRRGIRYAEWRTSVFQRDDYSCQECGVRGGNGKKIILNADHIKLYSLYPELRYNIDNGRTLCLPCHRKTPTWGGLTKFKKKQYV